MPGRGPTDDRGVGRGYLRLTFPIRANPRDQESLPGQLEQIAGQQLCMADSMTIDHRAIARGGMVPFATARCMNHNDAVPARNVKWFKGDDVVLLGSADGVDPDPKFVLSIAGRRAGFESGLLRQLATSSIMDYSSSLSITVGSL